jgi:hypothetical protein
VRYLTIEDGRTVERDTNDDRVDELLTALKRSVDDKRWGQVRSDTLVIWEGTKTLWGTLAGNEKQLCDFDSNGQLVGGNDF